MHFSAQEEYGLRCLLRLAHAAPDQSRTINEITLMLLVLKRKAANVKAT